MDALAVTLFGVTFSGTQAAVGVLIVVFVGGGAAWFLVSRRRR